MSTGSGAIHYADMETLQKDLDDWLNYYNNERTHQGKVCNGRTPMETLLSGKLIWDGKNLNQIQSDRHHENSVTVRSGLS